MLNNASLHASSKVLLPSSLATKSRVTQVSRGTLPTKRGSPIPSPPRQKGAISSSERDGKEPRLLQKKTRPPPFPSFPKDQSGGGVPPPPAWSWRRLSLSSFFKPKRPPRGGRRLENKPPGYDLQKVVKTREEGRGKGGGSRPRPLHFYISASSLNDFYTREIRSIWYLNIGLGARAFGVLTRAKSPCCLFFFF